MIKLLLIVRYKFGYTVPNKCNSVVSYNRFLKLSTDTLGTGMSDHSCGLEIQIIGSRKWLCAGPREWTATKNE